MQVSEAIISAWVRHVKNLQRSLSHFFLYIIHMHSLRDQKQMCRDLFCHCPLNCSALVQVSQRRLWSTASASWASAWASRRGSQSALTRDDALRTCPARALCTNASSSASSSSFILRVEILDAARFSPSALQPSSPGAPARPGRLCSVLASSPSASLLVLPCRRRRGGPRRDRTAPPRVPSRRRAPARRSGAAAARSGRRAWTPSRRASCSWEPCTASSSSSCPSLDASVTQIEPKNSSKTQNLIGEAWSEMILFDPFHESTYVLWGKCRRLGKDVVLRAGALKLEYNPRWS